MNVLARPAIGLTLAAGVLFATYAIAQQPAVDPRIGMGGFKPERMESKELAPPRNPYHPGII